MLRIKIARPAPRAIGARLSRDTSQVNANRPRGASCLRGTGDLAVTALHWITNACGHRAAEMPCHPGTAAGQADGRPSADVCALVVATAPPEAHWFPSRPT
jgi:hypothetical protein